MVEQKSLKSQFYGELSRLGANCNPKTHLYGVDKPAPILAFETEGLKVERLRVALGGCDGSGKSYYGKWLSWLWGMPIYREPGGSRVGEFLRGELLDLKSDYSERSRRLMFLTARSVLWDKLPDVCLLDRSVVCYLVYDEGKLEVNLQLLELLGIPFPDYVILLENDLDVIVDRLVCREPEILTDSRFFETWCYKMRSRDIESLSDKDSIESLSDKDSNDTSLNKDSLKSILGFIQDEYVRVCEDLVERDLIKGFIKVRN